MGYYNKASGTTQYVDDSGAYTAALSSLSITTAKTFYAQWTRVSYKATLDDNGGAGGAGAFYFDGETANFYADDQLTTPATAVAVPTREGYDFTGYYATSSGGSNYVSETGSIVVAVVLTEDVKIFAVWQGREYTLTFDYNGGTGETVSKTVTFGSAVGTLPAATHDRAVFSGWQIEDAQILEGTIWNIPHDAEAIAVWLPDFGGIVDWFKLGSSRLVPFDSDAGVNRQQIVTRHYGRYKNVGGSAYEGASAVSIDWRNPVVKYMVVRDMTGNSPLHVTLGAADAGTSSATGYMITSVTVETAEKKFPVVTVQGTANEGVAAINQFDIYVPILARARAQNLLNALATQGGEVKGGGMLSCSLRAMCDPVVLTENMVPCASDVVGGRYEIHAETKASSGESPPSVQNGFTNIGVSKVESGQDYARYTLEARKEM